MLSLKEFLGTIHTLQNGTADVEHLKRPRLCAAFGIRHFMSLNSHFTGEPAARKGLVLGPGHTAVRNRGQARVLLFPSPSSAATVKESSPTPECSYS